MDAIELYRKANHSMEAARLLQVGLARVAAVLDGCEQSLPDPPTHLELDFLLTALRYRLMVTSALGAVSASISCSLPWAKTLKKLSHVAGMSTGDARSESAYR